MDTSTKLRFWYNGVCLLAGLLVEKLFDVVDVAGVCLIIVSGMRR